MPRELLVTMLTVSLTLASFGCMASGRTTPEEVTVPTEKPTETVEATEAGEPSGSPAPTETATRIVQHPTVDVSECALDASNQADVTVPDGTSVEGGEDFKKTWRIKNAGTCVWSAGYRLTFVGGDQMDGAESVSVPETSPGQSAEISVGLTAPDEEGVYKGRWQMCVNGEECFGDEVFVQVVSAGLPTSTPLPTATPQVVATAKGSIEVPGTAFLDGRDPEASPPGTVMSINIWDGVPRLKVVCRLSHGVSVNVVDAGYYAEEDRCYFRVRKGTCEGWVSEPFVSPEYHPPIGDALP